MNSKWRTLLASIVILFACMAPVGCVSSGDLRDQADQARQISEKAGSLADRLTQILDDYSAGKIESGAAADIARGIIGSVNAEWVARFDQAIVIAGDVRFAISSFIEQIPGLQANLNERAINLDQLAAEKQSEWVNAIGMVIEWGAVIFGAGGIATGIRQTIKAVQATRDAESIVRGVQFVRKMEPSVDAAFKGAPGQQAKLHTTPGAQKLIRKITKA